ncbi:MAG TPA: FRG domain-containing protein [Burkholderiales bacterium]
MQEIDLESWKNFEDRISELARQRSKRKSATGNYISPYLFRGQSRSSWPLTTTLERYNGPLGLNEYYGVVLATKPHVETITSQTWLTPSHSEYSKHLEENGVPGGEFPGCEYFVYLRHHGFPSPLLDWTRSPYVAAYFAFRDPPSDATKISMFAYCEFTAGHKLWSSDEPKITSLGHNIRSHRRHFQQRSEYTICTIGRANEFLYACHADAFMGNTEDQDELWKFNIPVSERYKVLSSLEQYNINAFSLFGSDESLMETLAIREILLRSRTA